MRFWGMAVVAIGAATFAVACGGETIGSPNAAASGSASTSGGTSGTNVSAATACGDLFDTNTGAECSGIVPPATELARERMRYVSLCESALALSGQGVTASALEGCAQALKVAGGCAGAANGPAACVVATTGGLPGGATCLDQGQCSSGECLPTNASSLCGQCAAPTPVGQDCSASDCVGTVCVGSPPTCQLATHRTAGGCDSRANLCAAGLTCSTITSECTIPGEVGAPCMAPSDCDSTITCNLQSQICQPRGTAGAPCGDDIDCAGGLGCVPNAQGVTHCGAITWASPGAPCDATVRCFVGSCDVASGQPLDSPGACPDVIPDGQACSYGESTAQCDVYAECINGICTLGESQSCQ